MLAWGQKLLLIRQAMIQSLTRYKNKFIDQVKLLNKGETVDNELIWRTIEQGENSEQTVSYFCLQLFDKVLDSSKKMYLLQNEERIYATLLCLELYKNKKPKSNEVIEQCRICLEKKASTHAKGFMQFLLKAHREEELVEFFVSRLVMVPKDVDWSLSIRDQIEKQIKEADQFSARVRVTQQHKGYDVMKKKSYPRYQITQSKLLSFGYICFVDHIRSHNNSLLYYQYCYMKDTLKVLIHGSDRLIGAQELTSVMVHLLGKCITFYGCFHEDVLKELAIWANQLRMYTGVVGDLGADLFALLLQEMKIPGSAFRRKLRRDFPSLDMKESVFLNRELYFITDGEDLFSCQQDQALITLRKLIIYHCLKVAKLDEDKILQFRPILKTLNNESAYALYNKCMQIIETIGKMDNASAIKASMKQYMARLLGESMARYEGQVVEQDSIQAEQFETLSKKVNENGMFEYPKYCIKTIHIENFASKEGTKNLKKIIEKNKANFIMKGALKNKIPLIFQGDGYSFNKFVRTIASYLQHTQFEEMKQFQVYIVPKQECGLRTQVSNYLMHKDHWYRRFVYNIFRQKVLYPHFEITNKNKDLFPFYLYKKYLEFYLREATCTVPIRVYKCMLKMAEVEQEECIYMTSYLTMGLFCEAEIIKMTKEREKGKEERYIHKQVIEVIEDKIKKIPVMTLSIQAEVVQPFATGTKTKRQESMKVEDIQICSMPHEYFMGRTPDPTSLCLQMTVLTQHNGKLFRKQIGHSDNFKQRRQTNEIFKAFQDFFISQTVRSVTITNLDKNAPLRLMIDGTIANKIEKITIQPAMSASGFSISIPVQTFLPC